jgi:hypothetical protein
MSEQVATGNGASGVQAPKPAVAPTPKNGEGAVVPSTPVEAPKWQPLKLKLPTRDGEPEEVEFASEEEAVRTAIRAKQFDRANKERLELARWKAETTERAKKGDVEAIKALGFDPEAYFQKRLEEEARRHQMTEQERAIDDAKRSSEAAERKAQSYKQQLRQHLEEQAEARAWGELEPRLKSAMQEAGMIGDAGAMREISTVAQEFIDAGMDVPPEVVVKEAAQRDKERFLSRLASLEPKALWAHLPPAVRKQLGFMAAAEWRASRGPMSAIAKPQEQKPAPAQPKEYLTPAEYQRRLREQLKK